MRRLYDFLPLSNSSGVPEKPVDDPRDRPVPLLEHVVPDDPNIPYDMRTVVETVVDNGDFFEIMPDWAKNIVVGFARMEGRTVGVVGNQPMSLAGA